VHGPLLSAGDLARLRTACGRETVDPARSLFGPESVTWRVNREAVLLLGGGRALLLQVAHPLVAAGVAAHSEFRAHPLRRLWRTLDLMLTLAFADGATALGAVRTIEGVPARVHGVLEAPSGPFARGTCYDANDPTLLLWVYATLVDTALVVYERFVEPLGVDGRAAYYEGSKVGARLLGIPEAMMPPTFGRFLEYVDDMIHGDVLAVGPASREIAASILRPAVPLGLARVFRAANLFTVGLLPPPIRERYGLSWSAGQEKALRALVTVARRLLPFVPRRVRLMPHARRAGVAHGGGPPLGSAAG
jgi:uncharacterized protein (DUF2236 family)